MKKKIAFIILSLTFNISLYADMDNPLDDPGLNGGVKSYSESEFQMLEQYGQQKLARRSQCKFSPDGNKIEESQTIVEKEFNVSIKYLYTPDGKLSSEHTYNNDGTLVDKQVYVYEPQKTRIQRTSGANKIYYYNSNNRIIKEELYDGKDLSSITVYKYDKDGHMTEERRLNSGKGTESVIRYAYSAKGLLIKRQDFDKKGTLQHQCSYIYNENGHVIKEVAGYAGQSNIIIEFGYTYDSLNNWTQKSESMDGKTYAITLRQIEYY